MHFHWFQYFLYLVTNVERVVQLLYYTYNYTSRHKFVHIVDGIQLLYEKVYLFMVLVKIEDAICR